jgi:plasmid stabilization system protein ParE
MTKHSSITFATSAVADLDDILAWYLEQQVPEVGKQQISMIIQSVELLKDQPEMVSIVPEFNNENLRELVRPPYRIVYRWQKSRISIVRIWRSEKLLKMPSK